MTVPDVHKHPQVLIGCLYFGTRKIAFLAFWETAAAGQYVCILV